MPQSPRAPPSGQPWLAISAPPRGFDWPTAIGKKNWIFIGDPKSGDRAAAFYTLISNCHRAGIDAQVYLTALFTRLPLPTGTTKSSDR